MVKSKISENILEVEFTMDEDCEEEVASLEKRGWRVTSYAPIEKIHVSIIGRKFKFERS